MAKKKSKRDTKPSKKDREKEARKAEKLKRKAAKAHRKDAKKAAKKTAKKAVKRPKAAKKTAKKVAKKAAKKTTRPKAAKTAARRPKAAKLKRPAKRPAKAAPKAAKSVAPAAPKAAKPIAPAPAPKPPKPPIAPKGRERGKGADGREPQQRSVTPSVQPKSEPKPEPTFLAGHFDPGIERYYSMLAQNTPESHRLGSLQVDRILASNPNDIVALAEKAHDIVNNWRNDVLLPETIRECQVEFATGDPFACALNWAQRSIDAASAQGITSPYGYWARAYAQKYQKQPNQSAADYKTALGLPAKAFIGHIGRRRKDLIVEWLEGLIYWARREQIQKVLDKIESDVPPGAGKLEAWINWVKCFALHLLGKFDASNALYPDYLPDDRDVNLIIAANHARQGHEELRQLHRKLFLEKDGNADWNAAKEIERSPFVDKAMRDFWHESVEKALRKPAAEAPAQSI